MKILVLGRYALSVCSLGAFLAACSGGGTTGSMGASNGVVPSASSSTDMIYVSAGSRVKVYTYPSLDEVGQITGLHDPLGMCSDTSGNVFVTDPEARAIFEFAHGGTKQIAHLKDKGWRPQGCSVNPVTGDLAVSNYCKGTASACSGPGNIAVYKGAKGSAQFFALGGALNNASFCGYDDVNNLFVVGTNGSSTTSLAELASGSNALQRVTLNEKLGTPGNVQWDGTYVSVGDASLNEIHRFTITNYQGTAVSPVTLRDVKYLGQTWIYGGEVFIPNAGRTKSGNVLRAAYPAGGNTYNIFHRLGRPFGVTYSVAP